MIYLLNKLIFNSYVGYQSVYSIIVNQYIHPLRTSPAL